MRTPKSGLGHRVNNKMFNLTNKAKKQKIRHQKKVRNGHEFAKNENDTEFFFICPLGSHCFMEHLNNRRLFNVRVAQWLVLLQARLVLHGIFLRL